MLGSPQEAHALLHTLPHSGTQIKVLLRRSLEFLPMQWYNRGDKKEVTSMLVSTRGRYALRVMLELAQHGRDCYTALSSIASEQGISGKYLESIISTLSKGGLVEGVRGKGGGYRLTRPPEDYSVGEILRLAEGSLAPVACLDCGSDPCARAGSCRTRPLWERLDALICGYLDQVTLADLLSAPGSDSSPC